MGGEVRLRDELVNDPLDKREPIRARATAAAAHAAAPGRSRSSGSRSRAGEPREVREPCDGRRRRGRVRRWCPSTWRRGPCSRAKKLRIFRYAMSAAGRFGIRLRTSWPARTRPPPGPAAVTARKSRGESLIHSPPTRTSRVAGRIPQRARPSGRTRANSSVVASARSWRSTCGLRSWRSTASETPT